MVCHHPQLALIYKRYVDSKATVQFINRADVDLCKRFYNDPSTKKITLSDGTVVTRFCRLVWLPCGKCLGCRLDKSKEKAIRAMKHWKMNSHAMFITLTYDDKKIEYYHGSGDDRASTLHKEDFVLFMKRLREYFPNYKLTYIHSGEYGDLKGRAHHHLILYGLPLEELLTQKEKFGITQKAKHSSKLYKYYTSELLNRLWRYGNTMITTVSYNTCRYVSSYILKKTLGKGKANLTRENEYYTSSKGIGKSWFEKYYKDVFPSDELVYQEGDVVKWCKPGRYFMNILEKLDPDLYDEVKARRELKMIEHYHDSNAERKEKLSYNEAILLQKIYAKNLQEEHEDLHEVFDEFGKFNTHCTTAFGIPIEHLFQNDILRKKYLHL